MKVDLDHGVMVMLLVNTLLGFEPSDELLESELFGQSRT